MTSWYVAFSDASVFFGLVKFHNSRLQSIPFFSRSSACVRRQLKLRRMEARRTFTKSSDMISKLHIEVFSGNMHDRRDGRCALNAFFFSTFRLSRLIMECSRGTRSHHIDVQEPLLPARVNKARLCFK